MEPFGLYVHYPPCRYRCGYCDFPTVVADGFPHEAYTATVLDEIRLRAGDYQPGQLDSIYFGGGTPSLWPIHLLSRVVELATKVFSPVPNLEVTLEVNPGGVSLDLMRDFAACGVNRVSLGVQSLDDGMLKTLTRDHTAADARRAVECARRAGFDNINCDLIFGVRGQRLKQHLEQLAALLELGPTHVSLYGLTLSRGSALFRAGLRPALDDDAAEMLEAGRGMLAAAGYPQYEVSNYAAVDWRSRHNTNCWRGGSYLGIGAAAHSLLTDGHDNIRSINPPFSRYLKAEGVQRRPAHLVGSRQRWLARATAEFEVMMLGLRTCDGVDLRAFAERFGEDARTVYGRSLRKLDQAGLIEFDDRRLRPTARGIWFSDELACQLERET